MLEGLLSLKLQTIYQEPENTLEVKTRMKEKNKQNTKHQEIKHVVFKQAILVAEIFP